VTAQSIIPGILDKEQEQSVVHGSTDFGKTCSINEKYNQLLQKVCSHLKIRPHKIKINNNEEEVVMFSSIECKGIIGNDGRHYILDLLRMFPPDLNYTQSQELTTTTTNENTFPRSFRHKLCSLRQELIDSFIDNKYIEFVKNAGSQIKERNMKIKEEEDKQNESEGVDNNKKKTDAEIEIENTKQLIMELTNASKQSKQDDNNNDKTVDTTNKQNSVIIERACEHVGSWKTTEFDIRFNPNLYQPFVTLSDEEKVLNNDKRLLKEASDYIINTQIPQLIKDLTEHSIFVTDGTSLCEVMHSRGINLRYLGYLAQEIASYESLSYVHSIVMNELVSRCAKRVFRNYLQSVNNLYLSTATSHFMNCYLSSFVKQLPQTAATTTAVNTSPPAESTVTSNETSEISLLSSKKRKKNQRKQNRAALQMEQLSNEWAHLTSRSLWKQINEESLAQYHFDFKFDSTSDDNVDLFNKYKLRKLTLLRSFCQKNGVQLLLREYNFDLKHKETFHEDDILNMYPIVKHVPPKATDAFNFFTNGQNKIQQGLLKEGFELISESYNLLTNVYGALHPEICMCLRLMARLNYILCEYNEALQTQHKACMMSERLYGVDHSQTITEYTHLALYCFANNQIAASLKLLYRARYLLLINYGEDHPEMSLIDSNLGLILQASGEYDIAVKFLESSLQGNKKYFGEKSMKTALSYHLLARLQSCRGDFRTALMNERNTYQIYKALLGDDHDRTKESAQVSLFFFLIVNIKLINVVIWFKGP
jgi:protein TIF31